jgi:hypothetical protein
MMNLVVQTHVYGLGAERAALPTTVMVDANSVSARTLIAAHARTELTQRHESIALHYLLEISASVLLLVTFSWSLMVRASMIPMRWSR